jgi:hypothetical protein
MKHKKHKKNFSFFFLLCLFLTFSSCSTPNTVQKPREANQIMASPTSQSCSEDGPTKDGAITITISHACSLGKSNYASGLTLSDNSLTTGGNLYAINNAKTLMQGTIAYENTPIMSWGLPDPWPDPQTPDPTNWNELDIRIQQALSIGATPVISLAIAPWWMKGQLQADGTTKTLTINDEWANIAFASRILDNKMGAWEHLIQRIAERYMVSPYNVRYFQVWNELKGYYNPMTNNNDITDSPGDPKGPNAKHGYTYMYNRVYTTLMHTAQALNIPINEIKVGGPYVFMDIWRNSKQSHPSIFKTQYGTFDQRSLDAIQYWLQHKVGAGFITFDASLQDHSGKMLADPLITASIFADVVKWIRALDPKKYPDAQTLPIWLAEWFASPPPDVNDENYDDVVKSLAMITFIKAGGAVALSWSGSGDFTSDVGLWNPTTSADGGQPHPWYHSMKTLARDFGVGQTLYPAIISNPEKVAAIANNHQVLLINKTPDTISVTVNGKSQTLTHYQVTEIDY